MGNAALQILALLALFVLNGLFAMAEIAIVSARRTRLRQMAEEGDDGARRALELASNPGDFLATVQVGITLVGIGAGVFGGATLGEALAVYFAKVPWLATYAKPLGFGVVVALLTYLSLVIGELAPKRIALHHAEAIAAAAARPMQFLAWFATPIVRVLRTSSDLVLAVLRVRPSSAPAVTEEELKVLLEEGRRSGMLEESEQDMIEGVLTLDERIVAEFMTPRTAIHWIDVGDDPATVRAKVASTPHSRFPVADGDLDRIVGVVRAKDMLNDLLEGRALDVRRLARPPLFIPESMSGLHALETFKARHAHLGIVSDEYGGVVGLVTHNDILEAIAGYVPSSPSRAAAAIVTRPDGSWLVDGILHVDRLKEHLGLEDLPEEQEGGYHTVGGFVMSRLGVIPAVGQGFDCQGYRFEVMDMDGRRVDKILVSPSIPPEVSPEDAAV